MNSQYSLKYVELKANLTKRPVFYSKNSIYNNVKGCEMHADTCALPGFSGTPISIDYSKEEISGILLGVDQNHIVRFLRFDCSQFHEFHSKFQKKAFSKISNISSN